MLFHRPALRRTEVVVFLSMSNPLTGEAGETVEAVRETEMSLTEARG